jgi:hypothetical protein
LISTKTKFAELPIATVLLVLGAEVDVRLADTESQAWAVSQVVHTMLPTTTGVVRDVCARARVMPASHLGGWSRQIASIPTGPAWGA